MIKNILKIRKLDGVFIANEIATWGGGSIPMQNYFRSLGYDQSKFKLVILKSNLGLLKVIFSYIFQRNIIIVGFDPLSHPLVLIFSILKKNIILFPQTVEYQLKEFLDKKFYRVCLRFIMKNKKIACVSGFQKDFFDQKFLCKRSKLVNSIILNEPVIQKSNKIKIIMTGYYSDLKGVNFFSKLADFSKIKNPNLDFFWLGDGPKNDLYFSDNVTWLGYSSNPKFVMQYADIFLLSSKEESMPLVIYEALEMGLKCVAYKKTGVADHLESINGCEVFNSYDVSSAFKSINNVLDDNLDGIKVKNIIDFYSNSQNFTQEFEEFIHK